MKIWVENYNAAKLLDPQIPSLAIRVFDVADKTPCKEAPYPEEFPGDYWANTPHAPFPEEKYLAVWGYTFEDVNLDICSEERRKSLLRHPTRKFFSANFAEDILRKFAAHYEQAEGLLVHCHAGASRSPAIAAALIEIFQLDADNQGRWGAFKKKHPDFCGNTFVYRVMCEEASRLKLWK